jgi:signal transduction histidine kinase/CheY-like chemotaxis protein
MFARRPLPEATLSTLAFVAGRIAAGVERRLAEEERERLLASERAARADAEAANRIKDEFLATVSHELRTPLNAVLGWTRMLRAGGLDAELAERALETIERNADAQARLIDDLLDVSRIISGKVRLEMMPVDPASFVEAAVVAHLPAAEAKGVRVEASAVPGAGVVRGDPERLQQVVWNLVSNAIKFTPRGGRVEVRVARADARVEITVADTGKGIAPEFLPHVFDRFRQADATTTRRHRGLGLGLAIVRHLVELHGGEVRAESEGEGRGATFTVELPAQILAGPAPRAPAPPPAARLDGVRVLVVDDEADALGMLRVALEQLGAEVETAASAAEALDAFARRAPDVLVSDIGMPDVDGYELARRVRELPGERGGRVPAVALTAYARAEDRGLAKAAGYDAHVPKPVSAAELAVVIAGFVRA